MTPTRASLKRACKNKQDKPNQQECRSKPTQLDRVNAESSLAVTCVSKKEFNKCLQSRLSLMRVEQPLFLSCKAYKTLLKEIKLAKKKKKTKGEVDKRLLKYDIIKFNRKERLVVPNTDNIIYVTQNELFDVINQAHVLTGHGRLSAMKSYLKCRYANVTKMAVEMYLKLCPNCRKPPGPKPQSYESSSLAINPPQSNVRRNTNNAFVGFLNNESPHKVGRLWILIFMDQETKFLDLKLLQTIGSSEVGQLFRKIFLTFGVPKRIESPAADLVSNALNELDLLTPEDSSLPRITVVPNENNSLLDLLQNLIMSWSERCGAVVWTGGGLRFIQYMINITYNEEIKKTPFEAMFGRKGKLDVSKLNIHHDIMTDIRPADIRLPQEAHQACNYIDINQMLEVVIE